MSRVRDDSFAWGLCAILDRHKLRKIDSDRVHSLMKGWHSVAGTMIARLRGVGEMGDDFRYGIPPPPTIDADEVIGELRRVGWHILTSEEQSELHVKGWSLLRAYEARPEGATPDWLPDILSSSKVDGYVLYRVPPSVSANADRTRLPAIRAKARSIYLALEGKISQEEFEGLQHQSPQEYETFTNRPRRAAPKWAKSLKQELEAIYIEEMDIFYPGSSTMTAEERKVLFCHDLSDRLLILARSGRVTEDEFSDLVVMFDRWLYN